LGLAPRSTIAAVAGLAVLSAVLLPARSVEGAEKARPLAAAESGKYAGSVFDEGEAPNDEEWVRFRVAGKNVKQFNSRLTVICYVGPPTNHILLPVTFTAPKARISGSGRVDHSWTEPFTADGETYELNGVLKLRFKGKGKVSGEVSIEFDGCGTTTGDPPGFMTIRAKHK